MKQFTVTLSLFFCLFLMVFNSPCQETVAIVVSGAVINSGTYHISRNMRVLDAIKTANDNEIPDLSIIDSRAVTVSTPDTTQSIDLLKVINTGNLNHNPHISDGMHIHINFAVRWVILNGELKSALMGKVPFLKGETFGQLLSLYTFSEIADTSRLFLQRIGYKGVEHSVSQITNMLIQNYDNLTIFSKTDNIFEGFAHLNGEVKRPGNYSIIPKRTLAKDIIQLGGGSTQNGDIERAFVLRYSIIDLTEAENIIGSMESARSKIKYGVNHALKSKDFAIFQLKDGPVVLENGDEIVIPLKEQYVYVSGEVNSPGPILFEEGEDLRYYIKLAGGYTKKADRRNNKVITYYGKSWRSNDGKNIIPGNIIVVPQAEEDKKFNKFVSILQLLITSVTTALTLITFYNNLD